MQALAAVGFGLLIGMSTFVGVRLLMLHRRTGAWPELVLAGMLLLSGGIGYPARIAADRGGPEWSGTFMVISYLSMAVAFSLLFVFTWRLFRPRETWARFLAAAGVITLVGKALHGCADVYSRGAINTGNTPLGDILLQTGPVMVAYLWTAWESLRYHDAMRRRVKFGLADVTVSDRFLLWSLMALSATSGVALNTVAIALHVDPTHSAWILFATSLSGLTEAVLLMLAFVPPSFYLNWTRARGAASGA
jgi:hypothetical protein